METSSPSIYYSDTIAREICERLTHSTDTLAQICSAPGMPSVNSVYRWTRTKPQFKEQYDLARQWQAQLTGYNKTRQRFNMEIGEALCHAITDSGLNIKTFCSEPGMPHPVTVSRWLLKYPALREKYEAAVACITHKTEYSDALADKICEHIGTTTDGLHETCKKLGIYAHITNVYRWMKKHSYFKEQYLLAREKHADLLIEQTLRIADDNTGNTPRSFVKVQIAARHWIAERLNPRKWDSKMVREAANEKMQSDKMAAKNAPYWLTAKLTDKHDKC